MNLINEFCLSGSITERELLKRYRREYQEPIRLKVINFIKHWIEGYFEEDFANDPELLSSLEELIEKMVKTNKRFGQTPLKILQRKIENYNKPEQQQQCKIEIPDGDDFNNHFNNLRIMFNKTYSPSVSSSSCSSRSSSVADPVDEQPDQADAKSSNSVVINENHLAHFPPFETHLEDQYPYDILTIHPLEFARQATLMEQEIFKEIKVKFIF